MSNLHERIYELARHELESQERRLTELRTRLSPLLTAAAVIPALLGKAAFAAPHSGLQIFCVTVGSIAGLVALATGLLAMRPLNELTSVKAKDARDALRRNQTTVQPAVDDQLATELIAAFDLNEPIVLQTEALLLANIFALACEIAGFLGAAAIRF